MSSKTPRQAISLRRRQLLAAPLAGMLAGVVGSAALTACGGGGGDMPGASALGFVSGPISGLGSIIVGGIRFDDNNARVEDDDGGLHDRGELKLGMMVEVHSSSIDDNLGRGTAVVIRFGSELKGLVTAVDAAAQTIRMLDQTIEIRPETVFDPRLAGGFSALTAGQILEIHALLDSASGRFLATRIELEDNANAFRLRGVVSQLTTAARTFNIGDAVINYAGIPANDLPTLANGQRVRVRLQAAKVNGQWIAISVRNGLRRVDDIADARVRGFVTAFSSPERFAVEGIPIDATNARFEPGAGAVQLGALVEVRGSASNGTIVASRVKAIDRFGDDWRRVELHGRVSALNTVAQTFVLREVTVNFSRVIEWEDGGPADLANGTAVEVKGVWSEDRRVLFAAEIEFE